VPEGSSEAVEPVSAEPLPPYDAVLEARRLLSIGRPFFAHEVLEASWKSAPSTERDLWQGLAQVCVGLTHLQRGNDVGAVRLLERGANRLSGQPPAYDVDPEQVAKDARALAAAIGAGQRPAAELTL
jgi:predicted metal-dependent hydrolase